MERVDRRPPQLFATADSAPLFSGSWWPDTVGAAVRHAASSCGREMTACYLGASNGDAPEFYDMFVFAAGRLGFDENRCQHVAVGCGEEEMRCVAEQAALVLLSGGDTAAGWAAYTHSGLDIALRAAHHGGAVLVGISAGAIHLGSHGYRSCGAGETVPYQTLGLVHQLFGTPYEGTLSLYYSPFCFLPVPCGIPDKRGGAAGL